MDPVRIGDLVVDLAAKRITPQAAGVRLTPTEWRLLEVLLSYPGVLLTRQQLLSAVWGPGYARSTGNLRLYMAQLRRKLEPDPARPRWLITEPGMGYRYQPGQPASWRLVPIGGQGSSARCAVCRRRKRWPPGWLMRLRRVV
jgi:two-component system KDP operon response regulator KdpE